MRHKKEKNNEETPKRPYSAAMDPHLRPGNRGTQLASEALRALAAKEDFGVVKLRKADASLTPGQSTEDRPYNSKMLIQVKGKKQIQLKLVEPSWKSLNSGDCFLLVTSDNVFLYEGRFSNLLERAKAKEVGNYIVETKDMGCLGSSRLIQLIEEDLQAVEECGGRLSPGQSRFWSLLGGGESIKNVRVPKELEEDEIFEEKLGSACIVYKVISPNNDSVYKLSLSENYTGSPLYYGMLQNDDTWVLDFGSELYIWSGRNVGGEERKAGVKLARELLWEKPVDIEALGANPFHTFTCESMGKPLSGSVERSEWSLFGQVKENLETSLFRGKFLDWPEMRSSLNLSFDPLIHLNSPGGFYDSKPILHSGVEPEELGRDLFKKDRKEPDLVLEDQSVGRGHGFVFCSQSKANRLQVLTEKVTVYHVPGSGDSPTEMSQRSFAQLHMEDCYIIKWNYRLCYADAKSLSGGESKHGRDKTGRNRSAFFYWHGADSSRSDQGACALALRDLDPEHHPQVRVSQGLEPPAFLNLFKSELALHRGKRGRRRSTKGWRLYGVFGGPFETESYLVEVDSDPELSLRSQGIFFLSSIERNLLLCWRGGKASAQLVSIAHKMLNSFKEKVPPEFGFTKVPTIKECTEGEEPTDWLKASGVSANKVLFPKPSSDFDPKMKEGIRLFQFTSTSSKEFKGVEMVSSWFSHSLPSTFPFQQEDLYGVTQPSFFLLDQGSRVWLWEGWVETEENSGVDESVAQKLRLARLFAVKTTVAYCDCKGFNKSDNESSDRAVVIYAGLEPPEFRALFPIWTEQEEAVQANLKAMRAPNAKVSVYSLLEELSISVYPASRLKQKPLPEGVDSSRLESYLSDQEFLEIFGISKASFYDLSSWKQIRLKKESQLF